MSQTDTRPAWTFLTHHARVLILIARDPAIRLRDVAAACDVTERTVQGIVADLEAAGYLKHRREGRRNRYEVISGTSFRHPAEADRQVAGLLALINGEPGPQPASDGQSPATSNAADGFAAEPARHRERRERPVRVGS